ncbi:uncharacterized protein LOC100574457 [Acyrthosiphon pisum]|uniref:MYND-type domain-containing protein n=1 Tax=Acyrthosiphon pisum TaxID=7029 RepID=A0A8R2D4U8_ACYPI|nr:uncharacterized protein LOC100574457 [Acyrthosiphon pisum]|eukprot:XP_016661575.1 PREDICTED: uncharacterized protein LOC100574457 [Acyrthosiphon pisum]
MPRKHNFSKKNIDDTFKQLFYDKCVVNLTREVIENKKLSLENTTKEDGNTSKQNNISIDEEPVKKKQKLDTNGIDILKLEFREGETQFKSKVKSSLRPNNEISSANTKEVPTVIDCATESATSSAENVRPKIWVKDFKKMVDEAYLSSNKTNETKPPVNGKNHVKWNLIEIETLHNEYFSKSVQVNIVTIANIINVISMSNEYLEAQLDESTEKRSEAEKIKYICDARRLHERYNRILETKLNKKCIDITSSFKKVDFYSAFIMFFLSILTVLRVLDQTKFGNNCQELFEIVKKLLPESLINNECNHPNIFATFQSKSFYSDCMNVLSVINDSRDTDPGVTDRMPLYFLKTENSLGYFKAVINAVTSDSNEDLSLLIDNATFNCYYSSEHTDSVVLSTLQHSNYNTPVTETIQSPINSNEAMPHQSLSKNQEGTCTHNPVLIASKAQVIGNTAIEPSIVTSQSLTPPTTTCGIFQQKIQNKNTVANSYPHTAVCNTIFIDNNLYQLVKEPSGQLRAVLMPTKPISPLLQGTALLSDTTTSTPTITTSQSVNGPSGQMREVDNGTFIPPQTVNFKCDEGHCNIPATITCKCRKVNYCSHICRKRHWYVHYTDCEEKQTRP